MGQSELNHSKSINTFLKQIFNNIYDVVNRHEKIMMHNVNSLAYNFLCTKILITSF